ncbi:unnamed protein product [Trichogramma brassicae]|uniref:Uncharacterized protein n=1 Tax=Trichogramma brassicae TaxID=86971 RepID=A0A6H5I9H1_9HYME|nr:unnamed protein product [Trichogramma brassicae]
MQGHTPPPSLPRTTARKIDIIISRGIILRSRAVVRATMCLRECTTSRNEIPAAAATAVQHLLGCCTVQCTHTDVHYTDGVGRCSALTLRRAKGNRCFV